MKDVSIIMTNKLSHESWEDIYAVYFETKCEPTIWPMEGIVVSLHHMMYLKPKDVYLNELAIGEE